MGIYLNPDNKGFKEAIHSKIYVDKTGLIACTNELINTRDKYICVSRPRRFGKSMALEMLAAYYSCGCDSSDLFKGYKIEANETFQEHLNQYDVIFLNMQQFLIGAKKQEVTEYLEELVIADIRKVYGELFPEQETNLAYILQQIYAETGREFVFLIDEWDCVMRERQESEEMQKQYLDFLCNLLKDREYVALAYMMGILPIKKCGTHTSLNMFDEYSMTNQFTFEKYTGFTEEEVKVLCEQFGMDFFEMRNWYGGYQFSKIKNIYNPKSVVNALIHRKLLSYWEPTEIYESLENYINMDFDGLHTDIIQIIGGGRVKINIRSFQNDMYHFRVKDDVLTLLIHLGYLGYDAEKREVFIPNKELIEEFRNFTYIVQ